MTTTYSGFELSDTDILVFQRWLDFFAAATIDKDDTDAQASFEALAPAWLYDETNGPRTSFLAFIYNTLMAAGTEDEPVFNLFHGQGCMTDTEYDAGDADDTTNAYIYCALSYTQLWKFILLHYCHFHCLY